MTFSIFIMGDAYKRVSMDMCHKCDEVGGFMEVVATTAGNMVCIHTIRADEMEAVKAFVAANFGGYAYEVWNDDDGETSAACIETVEPAIAPETTEETNKEEIIMTRYEYVKEMVAAILDYVNDCVNLDEFRGDRDGLEEKLNDDLWIADSVTGNASGSYYCNAHKAQSAISGALDVLVEALEEFGDEPESYKRALLSPEYADVTIRCYLLGEAIAAALDEIEETGVLDEVDLDADEDEDETETEPQAMTA